MGNKYKLGIEKKCERCGNNYFPFKGRLVNKYCSRECRYNADKITINCDGCKKQLIILKSQYKFSKLHFCSKQCKHKGMIQFMKELHKTQPEKMKRGLFKKYHHYNDGKHLSPATEFKSKGEHPRWVGGTEKFRGKEWKNLRDYILKRDKHICKECGNEGDCVHHIIPYRIGKINVSSNLVTLCRGCHIKVEKEDIKFFSTMPESTQNKILEFCGRMDFTLYDALVFLISFYDASQPLPQDQLEIQIEQLHQEIDNLKVNLVKQETKEKPKRIMLNGKAMGE